MGKDVVSFLSWAAEPEMEERKLVSCCIPPYYVTGLMLNINILANSDGIQVDICVITGPAPSCILPAFEVVCSEVSQAGPWCYQLESCQTTLLNVFWVDESTSLVHHLPCIVFWIIGRISSLYKSYDIARFWLEVKLKIIVHHEIMHKGVGIPPLNHSLSINPRMTPQIYHSLTTHPNFVGIRPLTSFFNFI